MSELRKMKTDVNFDSLGDASIELGYKIVSRNDTTMVISLGNSSFYNRVTVKKTKDGMLVDYDSDYESKVKLLMITAKVKQYTKAAHVAGFKNVRREETRDHIVLRMRR